MRALTSNGVIFGHVAHQHVADIIYAVTVSEDQSAIPPAATSSGTGIPETKETYSKWWLFGLPILGILITFSAYKLDWLQDLLSLKLEESDQDVTESVLTNLGTAAFALVFFYVAEKKLVRKVRADQDRAVRTAISGLAERLSEIEDGVNFETDKAEKERERNIAGLGSDRFDFESLSRALQQADNDGALAEHSIGIPASDVPGHLVMEFSIRHYANPESDSKGSNELRLTLHGPGSDGIGSSEQQRLTEIWDPREGIDSVISRLQREARKAGLLRSGVEFQWKQALERLPKALLIADQSTDSEPRIGLIEGRAYEFVGENWAITTAGIESLASSYKLRFPYSDRVSSLDRPDYRPDDASEDEWNYLWSRYVNIFVDRPPF